MVPLSSHGISRVPWYSFVSDIFAFAYGTFTSFGSSSQMIRLAIFSFYTSGSSLFARRYLGNRVFFLFLRLLRCFSSPGSLPILIYWVWDSSFEVGFPIRISTVRRIFAPTRSFSQLVTSFFASWCLGILLVLFLT